MEERTENRGEFCRVTSSSLRRVGISAGGRAFKSTDTLSQNLLGVQCLFQFSIRLFLTMGAGASSPSAFFAFKVVQQEYDLLISREELPKMNLQLHLEALYATAMKEYHLASPLECTEPSCILVKMKSFDPPDDAKKHCKEAIAEALRAREKSKPKIVESDYSKGFSGSAADTKAEKDFEKMYEGKTFF